MIIIIVITKIMTNVKRRAGSGHDCPCHGRKPDPPCFGARQGCAGSRPDVQTYEDRDCAIATERLRKIAIALTPIAKARADRYRSRPVANRCTLSELLFLFLCSFLYIFCTYGKNMAARIGLRESSTNVKTCSQNPRTSGSW